MPWRWEPFQIPFTTDHRGNELSFLLSRPPLKFEELLGPQNCAVTVESQFGHAFVQAHSFFQRNLQA